MTPAIWLRDLVAYGLQIGILIGAAALLARLLRLRSPAAVLAYWQALLVACLALPVCQPWQSSAPAPPLPLVPASVLPLSDPGAAVQPGSSSWPSQATILLAVVAGAGLRLAWLGLGLWSLRRLRRRSTPLSPDLTPLRRAQEKLGVHADFYLSPASASPITFGFRRPVVLLPPAVLALEPAAQEAIACHELLHVQRRDSTHALVEEGIRCLLWFHPAIWWLIGRIHLAREQVVDQAVIRLTESREGYVAALLEVARAKLRPMLAAAPLFFRKGFLKKRVDQIFRETTMSKKRLFSCLAVSLCLLLLTAAASVRLFPLEVRAGEPSSPVHVVRGDENVLHRSPVEYPRRALDKRVEGDVVLEVTVDEQGQVADARVLSGPQELRSAALQSVLGWHYASPTPGTAEVEIQFRLPAEGDGSEPAKLAWTERNGGDERERHERVLKELHAALEDPNATAEQKARWKERLHREQVEMARADSEHRREIERKLKELDAAHRRHLSAEGKARQEHDRLEIVAKLMAHRQAEQEAVERKMKEVEAAKAGQQLMVEQQVAVERANAELRATLGRRAAEHMRLERQLVELHTALADPNATDQQKDEWKRQLGKAEVELRERLATSGRGRVEISGKLVAIRSERISRDVLDLVTSRLGVQVGDTIDAEVAERIRERVAGVDEHFRTLFHTDGRGNVTLVIAGP